MSLRPAMNRCYSEIRDQWLSLLVFVNYWKRSNDLAPDEWHWADRELMERGRQWMPCYWSASRFSGLLSNARGMARIVYLRVLIRLIRCGLL